ncbi:hypothetical protein D3C75_769090 [compost metagenome]
MQTDIYHASPDTTRHHAETMADQVSSFNPVQEFCLVVTTLIGGLGAVNDFQFDLVAFHPQLYLFPLLVRSEQGHKAFVVGDAVFRPVSELTCGYNTTISFTNTFDFQVIDEGSGILDGATVILHTTAIEVNQTSSFLLSDLSIDSSHVKLHEIS